MSAGQRFCVLTVLTMIIPTSNATLAMLNFNSCLKQWIIKTNNMDINVGHTKPNPLRVMRVVGVTEALTNKKPFSKNEIPGLKPQRFIIEWVIRCVVAGTMSFGATKRAFLFPAQNRFHPLWICQLSIESVAYIQKIKISPIFCLFFEILLLATHTFFDIWNWTPTWTYRIRHQFNFFIFCGLLSGGYFLSAIRISSTLLEKMDRHGLACHTVPLLICYLQ